MSVLSLSPRWDLFRFELPDDFIPKEVSDKWTKYINKEPGVIITPIDYVNESIKSITIPGIQDINIQQTQHGYNRIKPENQSPGKNTLGRLNVEPARQNNYVGPQNPLDRIENEITINFRMNQGLYNWQILYESILCRIRKPDLFEPGSTFHIRILNEEGVATSYIKLSQVLPTHIDGFELSFDKIERSNDTFQCKFVFNNIDFDFLDIEQVP